MDFDKMSEEHKSVGQVYPAPFNYSGILVFFLNTKKVRDQFTPITWSFDYTQD